MKLDQASSSFGSLLLSFCLFCGSACHPYTYPVGDAWKKLEVDDIRGLEVHADFSNLPGVAEPDVTGTVGKNGLFRVTSKSGLAYCINKLKEAPETTRIGSGNLCKIYWFKREGTYDFALPVDSLRDPDGQPLIDLLKFVVRKEHFSPYDRRLSTFPPNSQAVGNKEDSR